MLPVDYKLSKTQGRRRRNIMNKKLPQTQQTRTRIEFKARSADPPVCRWTATPMYNLGNKVGNEKTEKKPDTRDPQASTIR
jgi:hypothetical protein